LVRLGVLPKLIGCYRREHIGDAVEEAALHDIAIFKPIIWFVVFAVGAEPSVVVVGVVELGFCEGAYKIRQSGVTDIASQRWQHCLSPQVIEMSS
jgi:hypothetical protein